MTKEGSSRGLRSIFTRRRRISQASADLTPLTILQAGPTGPNNPPAKFSGARPKRIYASSPEDLDAYFAGPTVIDATGNALMDAIFVPPQHSTCQEDEDLELLEDAAEQDPEGGTVNELAEHDQLRDPSGTSATSKPVSGIAGAPTHSASRKRDRSDSIGGASITSVRSWKSIFRLSTAGRSQGFVDGPILRTGSVSSIRDLGISAPVAVQASTSAAVEVGEVPIPTQHRSLRERASSPAMGSQARFRNDENAPPLRSVFDMDEDAARRELLQHAVARASHSSAAKNRQPQEQHHEGGLRKRSSSIASLSSLFGAAIGRGSRGKEKSTAGPQPQATPGIALSNSSTSFTLLSAPQPAPLPASRKNILKPVTVQPAAAAVSGQASGSDLGCAPKHSLASSADVDGKASKRWKLRNRRKTAEVTAQTLKSMTQSRAVTEVDDAWHGERHSGMEAPSTSHTSATNHSALSDAPVIRSAETPPTAAPRPLGDQSPGSTSLLLNIGRWAHQASGRVRQATTNSLLSQTSETPSQLYSASIYTTSSAPTGEGLSPAADVGLTPGSNFTVSSLDVMGANRPPSQSTSPGSLGHWLRDLEFNLRGTGSDTGAGQQQQQQLSAAQAYDLDLTADLVPPRGIRSNAGDDLMSVQSNNGSAESIIFMIKPTAEPMDAELMGPRPQLSRRSTGASARNSMKNALVPLLAQRPRSPSAADGGCEGPLPRDETITPLTPVEEKSFSSDVEPTTRVTTTPAHDKPVPPLPTSNSLSMQLCELPPGAVSNSYDEETEVIAQVDESAATQRPSQASTAGGTSQIEDAQGMESQQVDPWGSFDAHLGSVAESDSAAAVLAQMAQLPEQGVPSAFVTTVVTASPLRAVGPSPAAFFDVHKPGTLSSIQSEVVNFDAAACEAARVVPAEVTGTVCQVPAASAGGTPAVLQISSAGSQSVLGEASADLSISNGQVVLAQKVVIEAITLNTLPPALAPMPLAEVPVLPLSPEGTILINPAGMAQGDSLRNLSNTSRLLQGATVEQAVAVTASLANLGSMSMISNGSSTLAARNSVEGVAEPLTPTEAMMATPSLVSHSFGTADSDTSSDSLCSVSHEADQGLSSFGDVTSTPLRPKGIVEETEHFDEWGTTPNGLLLDLSLDGRPSPAHFEDAVRSFRDRQQRERERTQTQKQAIPVGINEGGAVPALPSGSLFSVTNDSSAATGLPDNGNETTSTKSIAGVAQQQATQTVQDGISQFVPAPRERAGSVIRQKYALRQHKSGNALGNANVHVSATMPDILKHKNELEAKRASMPGGLVTLGEFLTELKAPVDLACPPPPVLPTARRGRRSKTYDGTRLYGLPRTGAQVDLPSGQSPERVDWSVHRRARTTSGTTSARRLGRKQGSTTSADDEVPLVTMLQPSLSTIGHPEDGSFTREEWQRFALGHLGASLQNSELDPDASRRAMHTSSPSPPPGNAREGTIIEEEDETDGAPLGGGGGAAVVETMEPQDEPRSSTPAPMSALQSSKTVLLGAALRNASVTESGPQAEMGERSAALSEAPSTVMARCHMRLDDDDCSTSGTGNSSAPSNAAGAAAGQPADGSPAFTEVELLGACLSILKQQKTGPLQDKLDVGLNCVTADVSVSSGDGSLSATSSGTGEPASDSSTFASASASSAVASTTSANSSRAAGTSSDADSGSSSTSAYLSMGSAVAAVATAGDGSHPSFSSTVDTVDTDRSAPVDIVEHLLRKAMWARYEKARLDAAAAAAAAAPEADTVSDAVKNKVAAATGTAAVVSPADVLADVSADADLELD